MNIRLNKEQQKAAEVIYGPVMVIAGPGTGKTQLLSARIAMLLKSSAQITPQTILALTYTDAGVVAMRKRLQSFMGAEAYKINIHTFHSFCNDIIQWNPDYFGVANVEPVSELEIIQILHQMIDELPRENVLHRMKGDVYYEALRMKNLFQFMKEEGLTSVDIIKKVNVYIDNIPNDDDFKYKRANAKQGIKVGDIKVEKVEEEKARMTQIIEAANLFNRYNELLRKNERYEFVDMLRWVVDAFKNDEYFLLSQQEKYQFVLVDEMQDTSGLQLQLVDILMSYWDFPNVFVVGDDDQTVYEFNGARISNILKFRLKYKPEVVVLKDNYRSPQVLLDSAKKVIDKNMVRLIKYIPGVDKDLFSKGTDFGKLAGVDIYQCQNPVAEDIRILKRVQELIKQGYFYSDIGIIYRKHRQGENLMRIFRDNNIPVVVKKNLNVLDEPIIIQLLTILQYIVNSLHGDSALLFECLHFPYFNITHEFINRLFANFRNPETPIPVFEEGYINFVKLIREFNEKIYNDKLPLFILSVMEQTKMLEYVTVQEDKTQKILILNTFFSFVKAEATKRPLLKLEDFLNDIKKMRDEHISIPALDVNVDSEGVNFMSAHGAKGLEFDYVFILGANRNEWEKSRGNVNRYNLPPTVMFINEDKEESARRLFYVAMTRAKIHLDISFSKNDINGRDIEPSQFIVESELPVKEYVPQKEDITQSLISLTKPEVLFYKKIDKAYMDRMFENYVLSISHVNKYLKCAVSYYFENVLRIPFVAGPALIFGNSVHAALKNIYDDYKKKNILPCADSFYDLFFINLMKNRGQLREEDIERLTVLGKNLLLKYHAYIIKPSNKVTLNEYYAKNILIDGVPFKYIFDKIEFEGNLVTIVDYKTGKLSSIKSELSPAKLTETEGIVSLGGDYWRQMVAGKLVIDNIHYQPWRFKQARIEVLDDEFMGPVPVPVTPIDEKEVIRQIHHAYDGIMSYQFETGCGNCYWCNFIKSI